jgi:hypothetical protein
VDPELTNLSRSLVVELASSIGLRNSNLARRIIWQLFRPVTDRLAHIGLTFDQNVRQVGFSRAMGDALKDFANPVKACGAQQIPPGGPLLVVSNHPGTYDSLIISSLLGRDDLCIITGDIPFLRNLPHARQHFLSMTRDDYGRMSATRRGLKHMKEGGALLLYGYGHIDPDPAVYNDAFTCIEQWSHSIDLFMKAVPQAQLLLSIVTHVVSPRWRNSLLYRLRSDPLDRRRLVEFGQVISQLLFPHRLMLSPCLSFSRPAGLEELRHESGSERVLPAVISRAKTLLTGHMDWVDSLMNA